MRPPVWKNVHHPYSDLHIDAPKVLTYLVEEIFAEKLRAFVERMRPRDLYDIIHLHNDKRWRLDNKLVMDILKKKCEFKDVDVPTMASIEKSSSKADLISDWENMLAHQINPLESYDYYWHQLSGLFGWLYRNF